MPSRRTGAARPAGDRSVPNNRVGIQLYTLRDIMVDRPSVRRVLNQLGAMGYTEVEMAGDYDLPAPQQRKLLDDAGLRAGPGTTASTSLRGDAWKAPYQQTLEYAVALGPEVHRPGVLRRSVHRRGFRALATRLNEAAALANAAGLEFFYHNHDFEFSNKQADGTPFYDLLLARTDANVKFELDLYWILAGGENPLAYLSANPARYMGYHVKDRTWKPRPNGVQNWEDAGPGLDRLPGHLRRGARPPADGEALHHRARRPADLPSGRPGGGAHDRTRRGGVPAQRPLLAQRWA